MRRFLGIALLVVLVAALIPATVAAEAPRPEEDHNCAMYVAVSDELPDDYLLSDLIEAPNSLKAMGERNVDGWGIAYYENYGDTPVLERDAEDAYRDSNNHYQTLVEEINDAKPQITIGHVRTCTSGCCAKGQRTVPNPHPFSIVKDGKTWTFIQNGGQNKPRLRALIGDDYFNANPPDSSGVPVCYNGPGDDENLIVDSELWFRLIMKHIEENNFTNVEAAIAEAVIELDKAGETGGRNFVMSDGKTVWTLQLYRGGQLHYLDSPDNKVATVATKYTSENLGDWVRFKDYEMAVLRPNKPIQVINLNVPVTVTPNRLIRNRDTEVQVALSATADFNPANVNRSSVVFAGAQAIRSEQDPESGNLVFYFNSNELKLHDTLNRQLEFDSKNQYGVLSGRDNSGKPFWGSATVQTINMCVFGR